MRTLSIAFGMHLFNDYEYFSMIGNTLSNENFQLARNQDRHERALLPMGIQDSFGLNASKMHRDASMMMHNV